MSLQLPEFQMAEIAPQAAPPPDAGAAARRMMVDSQVRPNKVTDRRVIAAMRMLPRELFVPPAAASLAYSDEDVPLGGGRSLTEPMVIARLVQLAAPVVGERVLLVASGSGYTAALLAACGAVVTALESDPALVAMARSALAGAGAGDLSSGITLVEGSLAAGWPDGAPYDIVFIDGAVDDVPQALVAQLAPGGRIVCVRSASGAGGRAMTGERAGGAVAWQPAFDCAIPPLAMLRRAAGFVF